MTSSGDLGIDQIRGPIGPYLDAYGTPVIRSQQQKLSSFMSVVPYPPTDKSYQHIHTQVDIRSTLELETRKLSSGPMPTDR